MDRAYAIEGYVFVKVNEDSYGNCYYDITHPDGRKLDYAHKFSSVSEMKDWIRSRGR